MAKESTRHSTPSAVEFPDWWLVGQLLADPKDLLRDLLAEHRSLVEQLEAAETTLAHALDFIEHQDMSYRWAEWCEGRNPSNPASTRQGNIRCGACGASVAWEGERPDDCLRCGASFPASREPK